MSLISVLLVDDNPSFLRAAAAFLGAAVVDLAMPDLPGLELIPRLRAALPGLGIVAFTMYDTTAYREAALPPGDAFVSKTQIGTDLRPAICRAALARRCAGGFA